MAFQRRVSAISGPTARLGAKLRWEALMKRGWMTVWAATPLLVLGLAACGAGSSGASGASRAGGAGGAASSGSAGAGSAGGAVGSPGASATQQAADATSGHLTPPGTHLRLRQSATVGWVPPSVDVGEGAHKGLRFQATVVSIEKGTIADFRNIQLNASERKSTPYYVTVRITALGSTAPPKTEDPAIAFEAIDDRGQEQESITFFGTFERCDDKAPPKPLTNGKSYQSCLAYLMPGGGSIQSVRWNDGPAAANQVTPYFDKPIVWAGS
jgi:hypothetical protein